MSEYLLQHFQYGKLRKLEGADYEVVALSSGLSLDANIQAIPRVVGINLRTSDEIRNFGFAYGWQQVHESIILAYFQRSTDVESEYRPQYFIQRHYLIVPLELADELLFNLRSLFDVFKAIPRYSSPQYNLSPIRVMAESLRQRNQSYRVDESRRFVQTLFLHRNLIFDGKGITPTKRLNFLSALSLYFPVDVRRFLTFITSAGRNLFRNEYKMLFIEDDEDSFISHSNRYLNLQKPPKLDRSQPGWQYSKYLDEHLFDGSSENLLEKISELIPQQRTHIEALDVAAEFMRSYLLLSQSLNDRSQLTKVLPKIASFVSAVLHTTDIVADAYLAQVFESLHALALTDSQLDALFGLVSGKVDNGNEPSETLILTIAKVSLTQPRSTDFAATVFAWTVRNKHVFHSTPDLISSLARQGRIVDVFRAAWWNLFRLEDFLASLAETAKSDIEKVLPWTMRLMNYLSGPRGRLQDASGHLIWNSFRELSVNAWLWHCIAEALTRAVFDLLSLPLIEKLRSEVDSIGLPGTGFAPLLSIANEESVRAIVSSNNAHTEQTLTALRDLALTGLTRFGDLPVKQALSRLCIVTSAVYIEGLNSLPIPDRDERVKTWAQIVADKYRVPLLIPEEETANLRYAVAASALALKETIGSYPVEYTKRITSWVRRAHPIDPQSIFSWIAIFAYFRLYPERVGQLKLTSAEAEHRSAGIADVIAYNFAGGSAMEDLGNKYLCLLTREAHDIPWLSTAWSDYCLSRLPPISGTSSVARWRRAVESLKKIGLEREAETLRQSNSLLELAVELHQELVQRMSGALNALRALEESIERATHVHRKAELLELILSEDAKTTPEQALDTCAEALNLYLDSFAAQNRNIRGFTTLLPK